MQIWKININKGNPYITWVVHFDEKFEDVEANGRLMNKEFVNKTCLFIGIFLRIGHGKLLPAHSKLDVPHISTLKEKNILWNQVNTSTISKIVASLFMLDWLQRDFNTTIGLICTTFIIMVIVCIVKVYGEFVPFKFYKMECKIGN